MKWHDALKIINEGMNPGYMVSFEWKRGGMLYSNHFPDKHAGERLIETEEEAWVLARGFAEQTKGNAVNIYVTYGNFTPVKNYKDREIKNR